MACRKTLHDDWAMRDGLGMCFSVFFKSNSDVNRWKMDDIGRAAIVLLGLRQCQRYFSLQLTFEE